MKKFNFTVLFIFCIFPVAYAMNQQPGNPVPALGVPRQGLIANLAVNVRDDQGWTALHRAAYSNNQAEIRRLLQQPGIDPEVHNNAGHTPLELARNWHQEVAVVELENFIRMRRQHQLGVRGRAAVAAVAVAPVHAAQQQIGYVPLNRRRPAVELQVVPQPVQRVPVQAAQPIPGRQRPVVIPAVACQPAQPAPIPAEELDRRMRQVRGNVPLMIEAIRQGANVNMVFPEIEGCTALHMALMTADLRGALDLLDIPNINPDMPNNNGETPLFSALGLAGHAFFDDYLLILALLCSNPVVNKNRRNAQGGAPLHRACASNNAPAVLALILHDDVDVNVQEFDYRRTPLYLAAAEGNFDVINVLMTRRDLDPNIPNHYQRTPLHEAALHGHQNILRALTGIRGINLNARDRDGFTALQLARRAGNQEAARFLLQLPGIQDDQPVQIHPQGGQDGRQGQVANPELVVRVQAANGNNNPDQPVGPSVAVPGNNNIAAAVQRIAQREEMRAPQANPDQELWAAVQANNVDLVRAALNHGARVNAVDAQRLTVLHHAIANQNLPIVELICVTEGLNCNLQDAEGRTPLHVAAQIGDVAIMENLMHIPGINVNLTDNNGNTPFHVAAMLENPECASLLIRHRDALHLDINVPNLQGETPFLVAARAGNAGLMYMLMLIPGLNVYVVNRRQQNVLHIATEHNQQQVIELLVYFLNRHNINFDINQPDNNQMRPLDYARRNHNDAMIYMFLDTERLQVRYDPGLWWAALRHQVNGQATKSCF